MTKTGLVVSAHSADFVWRCGGAIALHAARGCAMTIVCLSYGERGESERLWRQKGITLEEVKSARRKEAEAAAKVLEGTAGGGAVRVRATGGLEFEAVIIDPSVVDPAAVSPAA